jgi:hypothetical protein
MLSCIHCMNHRPGIERICDVLFAFSTIPSVFCCRQLCSWSPLSVHLVIPPIVWHTNHRQSLVLDIRQAWDSGLAVNGVGTVIQGAGIAQSL